MAKRKSKPPENETKEQRFKRVVVPRVNKALKAIRLIGNCSGSGYAYREEDAVQIFNALADAVNEAQAKFMTRASESTDFKL